MSFSRVQHPIKNYNENVTMQYIHKFVGSNCVRSNHKIFKLISFFLEGELCVVVLIRRKNGPITMPNPRPELQTYIISIIRSIYLSL